MFDELLHLYLHQTLHPLSYPESQSSEASSTIAEKKGILKKLWSWWLQFVARLRPRSRNRCSDQTPQTLSDLAADMATSRFDKLKDKNVLVLGGSSGIGFAVAEGALSSGARVFIASSNPEKVSKAVERLQAAVPSAVALVSGHHVDLSTASELDAQLAQLLQSLGVTMDHIVFTAGNVTQIGPIEQATFEDIVSRGVVRFFGPLLLAKHARAHIRNDAASSITLTGASTSDKPLDNYAVEAGYASGLEGMARSLSIDLAPIRVNVIKVGVVRTEIFDRIPEDYLGPVLAKMTASTTINEVGDPQDVAEAYLHAMKDRYFVGQSISVDGGFTLK